MIYLLLALLIGADALLHWYLIDKKGARIYHGLSGAYRIAACIGLYFWMNGDPSTLVKTMWMLSSFMAYWLFFNLTLNALRYKPIGYVGKKAILDKIEGLVPPIAALFWKAVLLAGFTHAYYHPELMDPNYYNF